MADDDKIRVGRDDARAGATPHVTRYVLGISLALVVVLFAVILLVFNR
ncbi:MULTISPECIES: hypothetical protein [unclassified Sphingomonas]|nr:MULTISPECIES: hypothetical protein [unclassified Sphingomonas]